MYERIKIKLIGIMIYEEANCASIILHDITKIKSVNFLKLHFYLISVKKINMIL